MILKISLEKCYINLLEELNIYFPKVISKIIISYYTINGKAKNTYFNTNAKKCCYSKRCYFSPYYKKNHISFGEKCCQIGDYIGLVHYFKLGLSRKYELSKIYKTMIRGNFPYMTIPQHNSIFIK